MRILKTTVKIVKENKVDLMIPTGSHDAQFSMSTTTEVPQDEYPAAFTTAALTFHGAPPLTIHHKWGIFMLDTDHYVRRTIIPPSSPSNSSTSSPSSAPYDPSSPSVPPAPLTIQERWHSLTRDGSRGVDVFYELGKVRQGCCCSSGEQRDGGPLLSLFDTSDSTQTRQLSLERRPSLARTLAHSQHSLAILSCNTATSLDVRVPQQNTPRLLFLARFCPSNVPSGVEPELVLLSERVRSE
ncbi:hypothetical protein AAT19DRAFT_14011 [Rhodotorula toruloides]|uniref:Uncharacterized protein n=1 Tax=Rhodotorula toruloides TaxID=5286 RepID=A0A2T0AAG2_RHOTO|nr:hypothetical protein AAT19DRAFT_14011 [Rhodotorula toruloides]